MSFPDILSPDNISMGAMWTTAEVAQNLTELPQNLTGLPSTLRDEGEKEFTRSWGVSVVCTIVIILVALVSLSGNALVIVVYVTCAKLQATVSNILVVSLAATDLTTCLLVMLPSSWALLSGRWPFAVWACDLHCAVNYLCIIVSMMTMALISGERFLAVTQPAVHRAHVSLRLLTSLVGLVCVEGVVFAAVPVVFRWVRYDEWEAVCAIDWFTFSEALIYVLVAFVVCFSVPAVFILITNTTIIWVSYVSSRAKVLPNPVPLQAEELPGRNQKARPKLRPKNSNRSSLHQVIVRSMLVVILAFFVFLTPFSVTKLIKMWTMEEASVPGPISFMATLCQFVASAINPFIYFLLRRDYRAAAWRIIRPKDRRGPPAFHRPLPPPESGGTNSCDVGRVLKYPDDDLTNTDPGRPSPIKEEDIKAPKAERENIPFEVVSLAPRDASGTKPLPEERF